READRVRRRKAAVLPPDKRGDRAADVAQPAQRRGRPSARPFDVPGRGAPAGLWAGGQRCGDPTPMDGTLDAPAAAAISTGMVDGRRMGTTTASGATTSTRSDGSLSPGRGISDRRAAGAPTVG